jgi:hypothetical protein
MQRRAARAPHVRCPLHSVVAVVVAMMVVEIGVHSRAEERRGERRAPTGVLSESRRDGPILLVIITHQYRECIIIGIHYPYPSIPSSTRPWNCWRERTIF